MGGKHVYLENTVQNNIRFRAVIYIYRSRVLLVTMTFQKFY